MKNDKKEIYYIGRYSNSQNANVYGIAGLSPCLCSGGSGHDATIPKILLYDLEENPDEDSIIYKDRNKDRNKEITLV